LRQVNPYDKTIIIEGTATDNMAVRAVVIYYSADGVQISTKAYPLSSAQTKSSTLPKSYFFSFNATASLPSLSNNSTFYYEIMAIDDSGNYTIFNGAAQSTGVYQMRQTYPPNLQTPQQISQQISQMVKVPVSSIVTQKIDKTGGVVTLENANPHDGKTNLNIPDGAVSSEQTITINQMDQTDARYMSSSKKFLSSNPAMVYDLQPEGLMFSRPVQVTLHYPDVNHSGIVDGTTSSVDSLKIMWWDGFDWRFVGGTVDKLTNTVTATVEHFSLYALFSTADMTDNDYRPAERIITPATADGINDVAHFSGIELTDVINIFDITGRKIRTLNNGTDHWDGRDDSGSMVKSGIYIYQLKKTGKLINGTIVVAK
jgi:hypothetical protein